MEKPMNEGYVKVSWENNAKTGAAGAATQQ